MPGIGEAFSIYEFIFGRSPVTGEEASRVIAAVGILTGGYGDDIARILGAGIRTLLGRQIRELAAVARAEGREFIRATPGSSGKWSADLRHPRPNALYVLDNGCVYRTNALGQVESVNGRLSLDTLDRSRSAQVRAGNVGGVGYDGGHLIGHGVGGAGDGIDLVPQLSKINRGKCRVLEQEWAKDLADGKRVDVRIMPVCDPPGAPTPSMLIVDCWVGEKPFDRILRN